MRFSLIVALLASAAFLSGCLALIQTANSIDSKIERRVKPDTGEYLLTLSLNGIAKASKRIRLEEYYDAQSSLRGNYWSWRIVGEERSRRLKIEAVDEELGNIVFALMSTKDLERRTLLDFRAFFVEVIGTPYWPSRLEGDRETFFAYDVRGNVTEAIKLSYRIDIEFMPDDPTQSTTSRGR